MQWRARKLPFQPAHEFIAPDTRKARRFRSVSGCEKESDGSAVRKMRRCLAIETSEDHITAFIEPMQCKPVTAPQTDDKWMRSNWEVTLFSRHEKVLNKRFPRIVDALGSLEAISFSMENWLHWIRKGDLHFRFFKTFFLRHFQLIVTPLIYYIEMANCS
jgi:hypothetical protein